MVRPSASGLMGGFMNLRDMLLLGGALVTLGACSKPVSNETKTADATQSACGIKAVRTEALDAPEKHAWDLFLILNHPAQDIKKARGEPDCTKKLGASATTSVWETWRLARTEVFLADGSEPPAWEDTSIPGALFGKTPDTTPSPHAPPGSANKMAPPSLKSGPKPQFDPAPNQGVFAGDGGIGETHMNRATYDFIKANCLWSYDGLSRYSKAVRDGKKPEISLPIDSQEVKAVWVKFTPEQLAKGVHKTYYTATVDGVTYGLTSFHLLTKETPNWFWATFHHKDTPANPDETPSRYPKPKEVAGTVWENYVLGGTQTDFVTATGKPTKLSDYYIEFGFTNSSCITCHAAAHGHPDPARGPNGKFARDDRGRIVAATEGPLQTEALGVPIPEAFERDGKPYFVQTDFLWSIPFRAREEQKPPPQRCLF